ncbi:MAG: hypothetical protein R2862_05705 [Thermoanaerobaculia bacterium]
MRRLQRVRTARFAWTPRGRAPDSRPARPCGSPGSAWATDSARFDEWEAFLSLDGGRDYSIRLTPHLDAEVRSFAVTLPDFETEEARLLLRFGDGRNEIEEEMPWTFAIVAATRHVRRRGGSRWGAERPPAAASRG